MRSAKSPGSCRAQTGGSPMFISGRRRKRGIRRTRLSLSMKSFMPLRRGAALRPVRAGRRTGADRRLLRLRAGRLRLDGVAAVVAGIIVRAMFGETLSLAQFAGAAAILGGVEIARRASR